MSFITSRAFTILVIMLSLVKCKECKIVTGQLWTGENWKFVTRFCFLSSYGKFDYELSYDASMGVQNIDLYYDTEEQWYRAYGPRSDLTTCRERESVLQVENNQFINLTEKMAVSGCEILNTSLSLQTKVVKCKGTRNFNTARDRWWFVAVSNCKSTNGLRMNYKFLMTNGARNDLLHYHFSADEFYIMPVLIVATLCQFGIVFVTIWFAINLKARQLYHNTYKILLAAVFLHSIGVTLLMFHYLTYAINGVGLIRTKFVGRVMESVAEILFVLLLILLAKGYTVTRARLRQASAIKVTVFMCSYAVVYAALFIYEQVYFDPGLVLYLYDSVAGLGLVVLRMVGWGSFIYSTFFTLKHYPDKSGFYCPFFCFYTMWFICGPTLIIVANTNIPLWVREKVVVSVEHFVVAMGHVFLLVLTRPSAHNKNFPYHVRTTQIGIMEAMTESANLGNNTLDAFGHGCNYNVTTTSNGNAAATDIFTVDSVANQRPPPYSSSSQYPSWSIPAGSSSGSNGVPHETNGHVARPKVYDPNEEDEDNQL